MHKLNVPSFRIAPLLMIASRPRTSWEEPWKSRAYPTNSSSSVLRAKVLSMLLRPINGLDAPNFSPCRRQRLQREIQESHKGVPDVLGTVWRGNGVFCFALSKEAIGQTTLDAAGKLRCFFWCWCYVLVFAFSFLSPLFLSTLPLLTLFFIDLLFFF